MDRYEKLAIMLYKALILLNNDMEEEDFILELKKRIEKAHKENKDLEIKGFEYIYTLDMENTFKADEKLIYLSYKEEGSSYIYYGMIFEEYDGVFKISFTSPKEIEENVNLREKPFFIEEVTREVFNPKKVKNMFEKEYDYWIDNDYKGTVVKEIVGEENYQIYIQNMLTKSNFLVKNTIYKIY